MLLSHGLQGILSVLLSMQSKLQKDYNKLKKSEIFNSYGLVGQIHGFIWVGKEIMKNPPPTYSKDIWVNKDVKEIPSVLPLPINNLQLSKTLGNRGM